MQIPWSYARASPERKLIRPLQYKPPTSSGNRDWSGGRETVFKQLNLHDDVMTSKHVPRCEESIGQQYIPLEIWISYAKVSDEALWYFIYVFCSCVLYSIPIVAPYHILLSIGPTCRHLKKNHLWLWQWVAHNASGPLQYQALCIPNRTIFKYCIAFLPSQWVETFHPAFCLLSIYFWMRGA